MKKIYLTPAVSIHKLCVETKIMANSNITNWNNPDDGGPIVDEEGEFVTE